MRRTAGRISFALALAAMALLAAGCATKVVTTDGATPVQSVTASGQGSVFAAPDVATMSFGVNVNQPKAKAALDAASSTAEKIIAALKKAGVEEKDIQTSGVNLYPNQQDRGGKLVVTGYEAGITVNATIRDIETVGDVIEAASGAGANTVSGPSFEISEDSQQRAQAIEKAVANARLNAEAMAKAAGKQVGDVISVSASNVSVPVPMMRAEKAAALDMAGSAVPIETGQLEVTGDVTVMFELK